MEKFSDYAKVPALCVSRMAYEGEVRVLQWRQSWPSCRHLFEDYGHQNYPSVLERP